MDESLQKTLNKAYDYITQLQKERKKRKSYKQLCKAAERELIKQFKSELKLTGHAKSKTSIWNTSEIASKI